MHENYTEDWTKCVYKLQGEHDKMYVDIMKKVQNMYTIRSVDESFTPIINVCIKDNIFT